MFAVIKSLEDGFYSFVKKFSVILKKGKQQDFETF